MLKPNSVIVRLEIYDFFIICKGTTIICLRRELDIPFRFWRAKRRVLLLSNTALIAPLRRIFATILMYGLIFRKRLLPLDSIGSRIRKTKMSTC